MLEEKHQDALRTIGEVADEIGVATHVLRFWESKFAQIKPQKRRGRRYYSSDEVATIKSIKELLYEQGYTVKGVRKFLSETRKQKVAANKNISAEVAGDSKSEDLFNNFTKNQNADFAHFDSEKIQQLKQVYNNLRAASEKLKDLT